MRKIILSTLLFLFSISGYCVKWNITNNMMAYTPDSITINFGDTVRFFIGSSHYSIEVDQANYNTATDSASVVALPGGFSTPYGGGFVYPAQLGVGVHYYFCPPHADHSMKGRIFVVNTSGINLFNFSTTLFHSFPNPVSNQLNVSYRNDKKGLVEIIMFDINGKNSTVLLSEIKSAGDYYHSFEIDRNRFGKGIYFVEFIADNKKSIRKIFIE